MIPTQADAPIVSLSSLDQHGRGLRVDFALVGDRYAHRIVGVGLDGSTAALMESVENSPKLSWPSSPALQGLNVDDLRRHGPEKNGPSPVAMLIGKAGDGHWSLSIEPLNHDGASGLAFDVACRVKSLPASLTSTYRVRELVKIAKPSTSLHFATHMGEYCVEPVPVDETAAQDSCQVALNTNTFKLVRETEWTDTPPATLRWRYTIRLVG